MFAVFVHEAILFDFEVLGGARSTLEKFAPAVLVEINLALDTRGFTGSDVLAFMVEMKYDRCVVVDKDNYIFEKSRSLGEPRPTSLSLNLDRRKILTGVSYAPHGGLRSVPGLRWTEHTAATGMPLLATKISGPPWSYALSADISALANLPHAAVVLRLSVSRGATGVFLSDPEGRMLLSGKITSGEGERVITLPVVDRRISQLIIRKTSGEDTEFLDQGIDASNFKAGVEAEL